MVQSLLVRSLVARFWDEPLRAPLIRHGANLHGRYLLPHFIIHDIADVAADLRAHGIDFDTSWLDPFTEFRFPRIGTAVFDRRRDRTARRDRAVERPRRGVHRAAAPPATSTRRSSASRCALIGADRQRYVVTCNGYPDPDAGHRQPRRPGGRGALPRLAAAERAAPDASPSTARCASNWSTSATGTSRGGCTYHVVAPRWPGLRQPAGQRRGGRVAARPPVRGAPASPRAASTSPTSGRSRPASPPMSARRASSICAGCVPCCRLMVLRSAGAWSQDVVRRWPLSLSAADRPELPRPRPPAGRLPRRAGPGDAVRSARRRRRLRGTGYDEFVDAAGDVRPAWQELGRSASANAAATAWSGCAPWCAAWSTTTASPTSRSTGTARPSPTATASRCRARGTSTASRCWSRRRTGRPWKPVWCSAPGCSTPC